MTCPVPKVTGFESVLRWKSILQWRTHWRVKSSFNDCLLSLLLHKTPQSTFSKPAVAGDEL